MFTIKNEGRDKVGLTEQEIKEQDAVVKLSEINSALLQGKLAKEDYLMLIDKIDEIAESHVVKLFKINSAFKQCKLTKEDYLMLIDEITESHRDLMRKVINPDNELLSVAEVEERRDEPDKSGYRHYQNEHYKYDKFLSLLTDLVNCESMEQLSNTPDYIIAKFLINMMINFDEVINQADKGNSDGTIQDFMISCLLSLKDAFTERKKHHSEVEAPAPLDDYIGVLINIITNEGGRLMKQLDINTKVAELVDAHSIAIPDDTLDREIASFMIGIMKDFNVLFNVPEDCLTPEIIQNQFLSCMYLLRDAFERRVDNKIASDYMYEPLITYIRGKIEGIENKG